MIAMEIQVLDGLGKVARGIKDLTCVLKYWYEFEMKRDVGGGGGGFQNWMWLYVCVWESQVCRHQEKSEQSSGGEIIQGKHSPLNYSLF